MSKPIPKGLPIEASTIGSVPDSTCSTNVDSKKAPGEVPSFGCIVYVRANPMGGVVARVANLEGITVRAGTERDALARIVPLFKSQIQAHLAAGEPIAWIDPPAPVEADEQKRFLPMHL